MSAELIRLAPEMEAALRGVEWVAGENNMECPECLGEKPHGYEFSEGGHEGDCAIGQVLAAIDAARKSAP